MSKQEAIFHLHTALIQTEEKPKISPILRVKGEITQTNALGFIVAVKALSDGDKWVERGLPFKEIILPVYKVDFVELL